MDKQKQTMRFSDEELSLIKNTFADNLDLLKAIRKVFLQITLSATESMLINGISKQKELCALIRKSFLPTIDGDAPLHQIIDLWLTVEIKGKNVEDVYNDAHAREKLIRYIDEQLGRIEGKEAHGISFNSLVSLTEKSEMEVYIDLIVRNTVVSHVEMQLNQFLILAGSKAESVEKTKERLLRDSSK